MSAAANTIQVLRVFKKNLIQFFDELISQFPAEPDLVMARIFLKDQVPIVDVMHTFIKMLLPLKEQVKARNEAVFINNNILFQDLSKNKVNHFKRLWRSGQLDEEDKEVMWSWFDSFVKLAERYQSCHLANATQN